MSRSCDTLSYTILGCIKLITLSLGTYFELFVCYEPYVIFGVTTLQDTDSPSVGKAL